LVQCIILKLYWLPLATVAILSFGIDAGSDRITSLRHFVAAAPRSAEIGNPRRNLVVKSDARHNWLAKLGRYCVAARKENAEESGRRP